MIYITFRRSIIDDSQTINNVWDVNYVNVEELYKEFMIDKSESMNIIINPHWLNIMNYDDHNSHISIDAYKTKSKTWSKILRQWNIDKFISEILKGRKQSYTEIHRFSSISL